MIHDILGCYKLFICFIICSIRFICHQCSQLTVWSPLLESKNFVRKNTALSSLRGVG